MSTRSGQGKGAAPGSDRPASRSRAQRTRAREFAVQALYQHLIGQQDTAQIDQFTRELSGFHKCDSLHYDLLLHGSVREAAEADALLAPLLDRPIAELSPIEHVVLWIGVQEFRHCLDVPWRVVINECVELAKAFGGTDGHKYINGVLNRLAPQLRAAEIQAEAAGTQAGSAAAQSGA